MKTVSSIMRSPVVTATPDTIMAAIARIMTNNRIGAVVIMEHNKPVGIITGDDVVGAVAKGPSAVKAPVRPLLDRPFVTVSPEDDILKATKIMIKQGKKRIPVVKDGKLLGIISEKEILLTAPELLTVLSEKLKASVERVPRPDDQIPGLCEECEEYSEELASQNGRWLCEECRE